MATTTIEYEKKSITMPKTTIVGVEERVPKGEFSAYVTKAVDRQLQLDFMDEWLARVEAEHGPADEAKIQEIMDWLAS